MDKKNTRSILQDALEEEIPSSQIQLWQAIKASLVAGGYVQGEKTNMIETRVLNWRFMNLFRRFCVS